jgi:hypothetical protein
MIERAQLDAVLAAVAARGAALGPAAYGSDLQAALRAAFPGVHITVCGEDDIPARLSAAAGDTRCDLYYVDAGEHCIKLTNDADTASGIVVALRGDD